MVAVGKVISPKSPIAILSNFLFELEGNTLVITGTDSDIVITTRVEVTQAEGAGSFCIDAKRILDLIKAMPDNLVTFNISDNLAVEIKYTNGEYTMMALSAQDYPIDGKIEASETIAEFDMPSAQIISCLDKVSFAMGKDDFRPQMQGVYWDIKEDAIVFVATNACQLAKYRTTQTAPGKECNFILAAKAVQMVNNIIGREATVKVTVNERSVHFTGANFSLRCCLLNGIYPKYERVIPKNNAKLIKIERAAFLSAVKRVSVCADSQLGLIKMDISDDHVLVSSQDINYSMGGKESVPCEFNDLNLLQIGFAGEMLCSLLEALTTTNINIRLNTNREPAVFLPSENDEFGELTLMCAPMTV